MGSGGPGGPGGLAPGTPPSNSGGFGGGMTGREFVPPTDFARTPGQEWPQPGGRPQLPGSPPSRNPGGDTDLDSSVPLSSAVSMVQERFNATAVKTDTVMEAGQLVYRIRLLSADRSRVWTVSVDARTGRIN